LLDYLDVEEYAAIKAWVEKGGSLYLSDMSGEDLQSMYPDQVKFIGLVGQIMEAPATVVSVDLQKSTNLKDLKINFDMQAWSVIDTISSDVEVLVKGVVKHAKDPSNYNNVVEDERPLAVKFKQGQGEVTYSSFHDEAQLKDDVRALLRNMILGL